MKYLLKEMSVTDLSVYFQNSNLVHQEVPGSE